MTEHSKVLKQVSAMHEEAVVTLRRVYSVACVASNDEYWTYTFHSCEVYVFELRYPSGNHVFPLYSCINDGVPEWMDSFTDYSTACDVAAQTL